MKRMNLQTCCGNCVYVMHIVFVKRMICVKNDSGTRPVKQFHHFIGGSAKTKARQIFDRQLYAVFFAFLVKSDDRFARDAHSCLASVVRYRFTRRMKHHNFDSRLGSCAYERFVCVHGNGMRLVIFCRNIEKFRERKMERIKPDAGIRCSLGESSRVFRKVEDVEVIIVIK